jgi:hypothetical protein
VGGSGAEIERGTPGGLSLILPPAVLFWLTSSRIANMVLTAPLAGNGPLRVTACIAAATVDGIHLRHY